MRLRTHVQSLTLLTVLSPLALPPEDARGGAPDPPTIFLDTPEGCRLLVNCANHRKYLILTAFFNERQKPNYCGPFSSCLIIKASRAIASESAARGTPDTVDEDTFFNKEAVRTIADPDDVARNGMTLRQLAAALAAYDLAVEPRYASCTTAEAFRDQAAATLDEPGGFILINFLRPALGQEGSGHISPLAAYNKETQEFLVLDVGRNRARHKPFWCGYRQLFEAMNTIDSVEGKSRGYLVIRATPGPKAVPSVRP